MSFGFAFGFALVAIVVLIFVGLFSRTEEGRQISWSVAAAIYVVATMVAYATG